MQVALETLIEDERTAYQAGHLVHPLTFCIYRSGRSPIGKVGTKML